VDEEELRATTNEELKHIPLGIAGSPQRKLRAVYSEMRRSSLSVDETLPRAVTFAHAVSTVRDSHPGFQPTLFDPEYFEWRDD